ncbi:MAG: CinA family protein [Anaerolineae bacterium]|nr:CinA family protein [Anaerolineae bacterium]
MNERTLTERLCRGLEARGCHLATAESCTGGLLSHWITNTPGSSASFVGGIVAYDNTVKVRMLGVPPELVAEHGAVSEAVCNAMARGVRNELGVEVGVAITGIAGPTGAVPGKPIGTVFVSVAAPEVQVCQRFQWHGDRLANKEASARAALELLLQVLGIASGS